MDYSSIFFMETKNRSFEICQKQSIYIKGLLIVLFTYFYIYHKLKRLIALLFIITTYLNKKSLMKSKEK